MACIMTYLTMKCVDSSCILALPDVVSEQAQCKFGGYSWGKFGVAMYPSFEVWVETTHMSDTSTSGKFIL